MNLILPLTINHYLEPFYPEGDFIQPKIFDILNGKEVTGRVYFSNQKVYIYLNEGLIGGNYLVTY
jgi:hypothetical protein